MSALLIASFVPASPSVPVTIEELPTFDAYATTFSKNYASTDERNLREKIFSDNLAFITEQNAKYNRGESTWFAAVNSYADLTNDEFMKPRAGAKHMTADKHLPAAPLSATPLHSLPDRLDWRESDGVVSKVKNQGGCGSCWAFSAVEALESAYARSTNSTAPELSPQQIVSCSKNPNECGGTGGCDGSTQPLAFNYTKFAGLSLESTYPYEGRTGTCNKADVKPVVKNAGFVSLPRNNYTALMQAVASVGPIAISVAAGGIGWQLYGGGVFDGSCGWVQDHAVGLVGYGKGKAGIIKKAHDYWLVRNSWGPGWGEKGYMRLARYGEGKEPCGMDKRPGDGDACKGDTKPVQYCGKCAVLSSSSYPTGVTKA